MNKQIIYILVMCCFAHEVATRGGRGKIRGRKQALPLLSDDKIRAMIGYSQDPLEFKDYERDQSEKIILWTGELTEKLVFDTLLQADEYKKRLTGIIYHSRGSEIAKQASEERDSVQKDIGGLRAWIEQKKLKKQFQTYKKGLIKNYGISE